MSDEYTVRIRSWWPPAPIEYRYSVTIDGVRYEFPSGTTREQAQSVLDEANAIVAAGGDA